MTKWDYLAMGVLTLFFTILVFYRIGNTSAPQSAYTATSEDRDIVIDLGDYVDVGSIHMFLGNLNTRKFSISAFNEVTGAWEVLQGETAAESVFAWNTIAINYNLRYLGNCCRMRNVSSMSWFSLLRMERSYLRFMMRNILLCLMSRICFLRSKPI